MDPDADPTLLREIGSPTPVPSMQGIRIVSVAINLYHSLALGAEGEVYSWGSRQFGVLGHGDENDRAVPSRIESLSRIERTAVGPNRTSAAIDEKGRLFTWGQTRFIEHEFDEDGDAAEFEGPSGLGYEVDAETESQATPKRVDALSQDRVVGVAIGSGFTLVVTDAGAIFSFGFSRDGVLCHDSSEGELEDDSFEGEVLPRRIEALAQTGRRFVSVSAGHFRALALTEEGELYGWGVGCANGHGHEVRKPQPVAGLIGQRVKLMYAQYFSSCAVTEEGELFTWGESGAVGSLGHEGPQGTPTRVAGLGGVVIAAVAIGWKHTLVADKGGVVRVVRPSALALWALGTEAAASAATEAAAKGVAAREAEARAVETEVAASEAAARAEEAAEMEAAATVILLSRRPLRSPRCVCASSTLPEWCPACTPRACAVKGALCA